MSVADYPMHYGLGVRVERKEFVFGDPIDNAQIPVLQELNRSKCDQIRKSWSSLLQGPEPSRTQPDVAEAPSLSDDMLMNVLPAKIRDRVFSALPLRVIKLPEMDFMERTAVVDYIIRKRLNNSTEEVNQRIMHALGDPSVYTNSLPWHKARYHNMGISGFVKDLTRFAVLSHAWGCDEPNYEEFLNHNTTSQGYTKLMQFCRIAHEQYGVEFAWADTVCINRLSSAELDESVRSMFAWYRESFVCIIHLANTEIFESFPSDRWFTRGWTLQELLAPPQIKFYNKYWQPLTNLRNDKLDPKGKLHENHPEYASHLCSFDEKYLFQLELLGNGISAATGIPIHYIYGFQPGLHNPPLPERLKWIARRSTTRPEDLSYSMMGMLGISISAAYGEGSERAFFRLFRAVLEVDWSPSWFLWGGKPIPSHIHPSRMIPSSPACYLSWDPECDPRSSLNTEQITQKDIAFPPKLWGPLGPGKGKPITLTNTGLPIKLLVVPANVTHVSTGLAMFGPNHDAKITCPLSDDAVKMEGVPYDIIHHSGEYQFALGVLYDFGPLDPAKRIYAVLLRRYHGPYQFSSPGTNRWMNTEWLYEEWKKWETGGLISFSLKDRFRGMGVDDLAKVDVSPVEVGWKNGPEVGYRPPKIELQHLYL